jgi:hypothetical protein
MLEILNRFFGQSNVKQVNVANVAIWLSVYRPSQQKSQKNKCE